MAQKPKLQKNIEQLWYTWSTTGLDALAAGFRVRAASPGLIDLYSQRMKELDCYLHYSLPSGSDFLRTRPFDPPDIRPQEDAPICLAFIRTESGEHALVHKVYTTGTDGRGRPAGIYFAHMLANLSTGFFSARDAIRFWRSPFWQTADVPASKQGIDLPYVSLIWQESSLQEIYYQNSTQPEGLGYQQRSGASGIPLKDYKQEIPKFHFEDIDALEKQFIGIDFRQPFTVSSTQFRAITKQGTDTKPIYEHLSFVLRAYLLRLDTIEKQEREKKKISDDLAKYKLDIETKGKSRGELKQLKQVLEETEARLELLQRREPPRIFIAAQPDGVAFLVAGLTRLLPRQLLKNMTFSTYESDVLTKLPLDIVGTVLLNPDSTERGILPPVCYQKGFALNTYQGVPPELNAIRVADAVPDVDYAEHYANFAVEKLQNFVQDNIEELDQFFKNHLGDLPEIGTNELPELSVHDFLYKYYYYIARMRISLEQITRVLDNPATAVELLGRPSFREQILVRVYRGLTASEDAGYDRETREEHLAWLHNVLPALLGHLREWCKSPYGPAKVHAAELNVRLDQLVWIVATEVYKAYTQADLEHFLAILDPLWALEPEADTWIDLLTQCYGHQQSQDFINKYWVVRQKLLEIAVSVLESDYPISSFLLNVQPALFGRLLTTLHIKRDYFGSLLPSRQNNVRQVAAWNYQKAAPDERATAWKHQATLLFLQKGCISSHGAINGAVLYDKETIKALGNDFTQVKELLVRLLKIPRGMSTSSPYAQWHKTAQDLFLALVNSGYEHQSKYRDQYKMDLLVLWFEDAKEYDNLPDLPLDLVLLIPNEMELFLVNCGSALLQRNNGWRVLAPLFWRMVEAEKGTSRNRKALFQLLDKHIDRESFLGLLDTEKFGKYFDAAETHLLLQRYSTQYTTEFYMLLMQLEHMDDISELLVDYSNHRIKEVYDLLMQHSVEYMGKVHDLLIQYSDHYTEEVHRLLTLRNPNQYRSEVHGLLMQYSNHYTEEVHDLLIQRYPDQYRGEAYELFIQHYGTKEAYNLFMRYFSRYREIVRGLLERYSDQFIRDVHELLMQNSKQYNSKFNLFFEYYCKNHENTLKIHNCLIRYSGLYREEVHRYLKRRYAIQHENEYVHVSPQFLSHDYHSQQRGGDLPQYLHDYPDVPLC